MYICLCKNVTDSQIKEAVCQGACSLKAVRNQLGVASQCGKCGKQALQLVRQLANDSDMSSITSNHLT